jgi:hypothetical protein
MGGTVGRKGGMGKGKDRYTMAMRKRGFVYTGWGRFKDGSAARLEHWLWLMYIK